MPVDLGPKPRLGYTHNRLERAAELRTDAAALAALAGDPRAGAYVIGGDLIVLKKTSPLNDPLFTPAEAAAIGAATETVFLGHLNGAARFGFGIPQTAAEALKARDDLLVTDLRSIAVHGLVDPDHLPPIAEGKAVLHWHIRHRFCPNCGAPTQAVDGGWRRDCANCKTQHFPRTDPVVIMLAIDGARDRCLLGRSPRFAPTMWSCLAGFVEPGESIEDAVHRETREETGIACGRVTYFASQALAVPTTMMIGCHAEATSFDIVVDRTELEDARWFSKDEVAAMLLRKHPQELTTPPPVAIAHHIIRAWVENEISLTEPAPKPPRILCAGGAVQDIIMRVDKFPGAGSKVQASEFLITSGGQAGNAAVAVARLGGRCSYIGALGDLDDEVANTIAKTFAGEHIDVSRVLRVPGARSSVSLILIDAAGEKMIATRRDTGLTQAGPDDADAAVAEVDAVLLDNRYGNITVPICNAAKARGIPRVLDLDMAAPPDDPLVAGSTHVIASAEAIRDSTGLKGHAAALLKFGEVYKGFLAVTDGPDGVYWRDGATVRHMDAFKVDAVDTLGAGDTFHGAFTFRLIETGDLIESMRFGAAAAAIKCTRFGGLKGAPSRAEVTAF